VCRKLQQHLRRLRMQAATAPDVLVQRTPARSRRRQAVYRYVDWRDRRISRSAPFAHVPPAALRFRVHGDVELKSFLETGRQCSRDIEESLRQVGRELSSFRRVLDFGCGCGRTLLWLMPSARQSEFAGTDLDKQAISWCRRSLDAGTFTVNGELPPLPYPDNSFDLVYAVSVFTHLEEELQFRWLAELHRVASQGAFVVVTVRGRYFLRQLRERDLAVLHEAGFVFSRISNQFRDIFPAWYQTATHTEEYVRERYSEYFEVVRYLPESMDGCQDVVVLRKRAE
jgi:ubiquinone/menaquinone biosynthesis C-methylase UbiE